MPEKKEVEITLVLDMPTRWSSSPAMLESALKMKKAFIRVHKSGPLKDKFQLPTDQEWEHIANLRAALIPIEILTKFLCRENVTILEAQDRFMSALSALASFNNPMADSLKKILQRRYMERRSTKLLSILTFTLNPTDYSRKIAKYKLLNVARLRKAITKQYERLFPDVEDDSEVEEPIEEDEAEVDNPSEAKVSSEVERCMQFFNSSIDFSQKHKEPVKPALSTINDEVTRAFETGEVMERLRKLEAALSTIPASSVECERAFSQIGLFHSKIRNRLNDLSLDYTSFGKHFLKNVNKK